MNKAAEVVLLIVLPLAWGLGVEFLFERVRLYRARHKKESGSK
ncbi:MAG: hypothetical protein WC869_10790 [Phycisphaerae bacterium]|jgi:hypothetical protein